MTRIEAAGIINAIKCSMMTTLKEHEALTMAECVLFEAEPTKHGRWIYRERMPFGVNVFAVDCSKCGYHTVTDGISHKYNYCPNCGARMDEEDNQ